MQRELELQRLQLPVYCTQQMELMIANGVQRMRVNKALDHAGHVLQAERNLRALVKYLCDFSRKEGTFPTLTETSFDAAMGSCPTFWPFCSTG